MQAPSEGADDAAATQAPDDGGGRGGAAGGVDGQDPQPSPRAPSCQGNSSSRDGDGGPGREGAADEGAGARPQAERAPRALAPGGDVAPAAMTSSRLLELYPSRGASVGRGRVGGAGERGGRPGSRRTWAGQGQWVPEGPRRGRRWREGARASPGQKRTSEGSGRLPGARGALTLSPSSVLTVPFQSPLEAEMARRTLTTHVQRLRGVAQQQLSVRGSALAVSVPGEYAREGWWRPGGGRCCGPTCALEGSRGGTDARAPLV